MSTGYANEISQEEMQMHQKNTSESVQACLTAS